MLIKLEGITAAEAHLLAQETSAKIDRICNTIDGWPPSTTLVMLIHVVQALVGEHPHLRELAIEQLSAVRSGLLEEGDLS